MINFLIGYGYSQSNESDILLLDISNNNEYKWTNIFEPPLTPSSSTPSSTLPPSPQISHSSQITSIIVGSTIGSLIFGFLLAVVCFLLYKWNKNKQERKNVIPTPGREEGNNDRNIHGQGREKIPSNLLSINKQEILKYLKMRMRLIMNQFIIMDKKLLITKGQHYKI